LREEDGNQVLVFDHEGHEEHEGGKVGRREGGKEGRWEVWE
jgi:hypothetical protein